MDATENFADAWEAIAAAHPDRKALIQDGRSASWAEFDTHASALAAALTDAGLRPGEAVAQYLYSGPEYLESVFAAFKTRLVPVNTNYRYLDDELVRLWTDADVAAIVFDAGFAQTVQRIRGQVPSVRAWLCVRSPGQECPPWASDYAEVVGSQVRPGGFPPRSGDDLYLLYTGGTTGLPRGVRWRQRDLIGYLMGLSPTAPARFPELTAGDAPPWVHLSASPLMHGTGSFTALQALSAGGCVATLAGRSFDAEELLDVVDDQQVATIALVGDAFCRPILASLDRHPERRRLASVRWLASSGAIWSADVKAALLARQPRLVLIDSLSSSEAPGMASAVSTSGRPAPSGVFTAGPATLLVDEHGAPMPSGTGAPGLVAVAGFLPLGYHKDPDKTAATFIERDGVRYSVPGDWATLASDGALRLLGRGAACINTGGEKVFAEEVEQALRSHSRVVDAVVVGVPDERLGERVVALVQPASHPWPSEAAVISHARSRISGYKAPKLVVFVDAIERSPSGKVDYEEARAFASRAVSETDGHEYLRSGLSQRGDDD